MIVPISIVLANSDPGYSKYYRLFNNRQKGYSGYGSVSLPKQNYRDAYYRNVGAAYKELPSRRGKTYQTQHSQYRAYDDTHPNFHDQFRKYFGSDHHMVRNHEAFRNHPYSKHGKYNHFAQPNPYPKPHPIPHPEPHPMPHPVPNPVPHPIPHPKPHPKPHPEPHPLPHPHPQPITNPITIPHPTPTPQPLPIPSPTPSPFPIPPIPTHKPQPIPVPVPKPQPIPVRPQPIPVPVPKPQPIPVRPQPIPVRPQPIPVPSPAPFPQPTPVPEEIPELAPEEDITLPIPPAILVPEEEISLPIPPAILRPTPMVEKPEIEIPPEIDLPILPIETIGRPPVAPSLKPPNFVELQRSVPGFVDIQKMNVDIRPLGEPTNLLPSNQVNTIPILIPNSSPNQEPIPIQPVPEVMNPIETIFPIDDANFGDVIPGVDKPVETLFPVDEISPLNNNRNIQPALESNFPNFQRIPQQVPLRQPQRPALNDINQQRIPNNPRRRPNVPLLAKAVPAVPAVPQVPESNPQPKFKNGNVNPETATATALLLQASMADFGNLSPANPIDTPRNIPRPPIQPLPASTPQNGFRRLPSVMLPDPVPAVPLGQP